MSNLIYIHPGSKLNEWTVEVWKPLGDSYEMAHTQDFQNKLAAQKYYTHLCAMEENESVEVSTNQRMNETNLNTFKEMFKL